MQNSKPYVILCTGQSNMARSDDNTPWFAPENLRIWNYDCLFGTEAAAECFIKPNTFNANYAELYGAAVARQYPELAVYVINISKGGLSVGQWLPGATSVNMLEAILNNVPIALDQIENKSHIDELLWWGHESDAAESGGVPSGQFNRCIREILAIIDAQLWASSGDFPIHFHRIHQNCHVLADSINFSLLCLSRDYPERIRVHDTTYFKYDDQIHLNADQKEQAASDVLSGNCIMKEPDDNHINVNLLLNNQSKLKIKTDTNLVPGEPMVFSIDSTQLFGRVITFSAFSPSAPLLVKLFDKESILQPSENREFVSFYVAEAFRETIRIALMPASSTPVNVQNMKLEIGYGYTPCIKNQ